VAVTLAVEGDETQTGFSFQISRGLDDLAWEPVAEEAVERAVQMLGAEKPSTAKVAVVLDPFAASSFLGVLAGALNADNVLKGRSLFAEMVGRQVGSQAFSLIDDGRRADGPGACPFDGEGVPSGRTELFTAGTLQGFLHSTYTARRAAGGQGSTGNAKRGGYKSAPGVGTSNFFVEAGTQSFDQLLAQDPIHWRDDFVGHTEHVDDAQPVTGADTPPGRAVGVGPEHTDGGRDGHGRAIGRDLGRAAAAGTNRNVPTRAGAVGARRSAGLAGALGWQRTVAVARVTRLRPRRAG